MLGNDISMEIENKVRAKITCYNRYNSYIQNEIDVEYVSPIRQYWITDILDLVPADFQYLDKNYVEQLIDKFLLKRPT